MKIFRSDQVREIDSYTIEHEPVESIDLMERAASRLSGWYVRHYHVDRRVLIFVGPGNNGGDGLAMARLLAHRQYRVSCNVLKFGKPSADWLINFDRLKAQGLVEIFEISESDPLPGISTADVVVDGIFGSGLTRGVSGFPAAVIRHINGMAKAVIAIDIPSGLFGEDNSGNDLDAVIRADYTLTFQFPFLSFFFASNAEKIGKWRVHDIKLHPEAIRNLDCQYRMIEKDVLKGLLPARPMHAHKGNFGHGLLIAGSRGMMGAALLAGEACLRGGAGLLTMHIPDSACNIAQTGLPEAIVSLDPGVEYFTTVPDLAPYSAVAIGPGLKTQKESAQGMEDLLQQLKIPLLIDADGLNILSAHPEWMEKLPPNTILTPHPGEFDRLAGESANDYARHLKQIELSRKYGLIITLKGANTGISFPDGSYCFNTTGNPGMATGGSGDVLTGLILGFLTQGIEPSNAAIMGVYLHGLAGDLAANEMGQHALIAGDLNRFLGKAFGFIT